MSGFHTKQEIPAYRGPFPRAAFHVKSNPPRIDYFAEIRPQGAYGYGLDTGAGNAWTVDNIRVDAAWDPRQGETYFLLQARVNHSNAARFSSLLHIPFRFYNEAGKEILTLTLEAEMQCSQPYMNAFMKEYRMAQNYDLFQVDLKDDCVTATVCG